MCGGVVGDGRSGDYVEVLRGIHFVHGHPEDINTRTFRLTCIELKDHYASNQLTVLVSYTLVSVNLRVLYLL